VLPAVKAGGEVYALTTRNTFESERFQIICERAARAYPHTRLTAFPCDGLAGAIEERAGDQTADYSAFLPKGKPDGVALGCTHYVHIKEYVQAFYGCPTFDGNEAIAKRLRYVLEQTQEKVADFGTADPKREKNSFFCPLLSQNFVWKGEKGKKRRFCWA
jgi:glutamate racemase